MAKHFRSSLAARVFAVVAVTVGMATSVAQAETRLDEIKARGYINCGVAAGMTGFSQVDARGRWSGLDVEFCSALAAAVLGSKDAVKFRNIPSGDRFSSLADGEVDVMLRGSPWTLSRDTELGARFAGVLFYDGQGFLVPREHAIISVFELSGASVCVLPGSSGERSVSDFFGQRKMRYQLVTSEDWSQLVRTYAAGGCTALTGDESLLAAERAKLPDANKHILLPELIDKSPLGPAVKTGDDQWFAIVRWTYMALIDAEELGLTRSNVDSMKTSTVMDIRRFLGLEGDLGAPLGLAKDWAYQVVKQVGNYGEVFDRTVGENSVLKLQRGLNSLWTKGGLMFAAPFR
jgi:general L-amino acid transport system substrate-binding protein